MVRVYIEVEYWVGTCEWRTRIRRCRDMRVLHSWVLHSRTESAGYYRARDWIWANQPKWSLRDAPDSRLRFEVDHLRSQLRAATAELGTARKCIEGMRALLGPAGGVSDTVCPDPRLIRR